MREQALAIVRGVTDPDQALNQLREYLQTLILRSFHESEAFRPLAFVGGTALRFLHGVPRFSEDLDFSLATAEGYDGREWMSKLKRDLTLGGFNAEVTWNDRKAVHTAWVRLPEILHDAGLAAMPDQKLAIKLEIDTRPPAGARCERRVISRHLTFLVQYYDLPSLLSGKLHAAITRRYAKGRDWYDLMWYLSRQPPVEPNLPLLQNALDQTRGPGRYDAKAWATLVRDRVRSIDVEAIQEDVRAFLERPLDAALLNKENLLGLLPTEGPTDCTPDPP